MAMTDRNTDIAQAAHDAYPHETWIFIDGAHWADQHPSTETINRIIELIKEGKTENEIKALGNKKD